MGNDLQQEWRVGRHRRHCAVQVARVPAGQGGARHNPDKIPGGAPANRDNHADAIGLCSRSHARTASTGATTRSTPTRCASLRPVFAVCCASSTLEILLCRQTDGRAPTALGRVACLQVLPGPEHHHNLRQPGGQDHRSGRVRERDLLDSGAPPRQNNGRRERRRFQ